MLGLGAIPAAAFPHPFTGVDYVDYYSNLIRESGAEVEVIFANDPRAILPYTKNVLACDIHTRARTKRRLLAAGAEKVFCLDEIMTASIDGAATTPSTDCWAPTSPPRTR